METYPVQVHVRVRSADVGPDGAVDPRSVLVYLQEARRAYIGVLNVGETRLREVRVDLEVLQEVEPGDELAVRVRIVELARSSFSMDYLVRDRLTREPVARARTQLMLVDEDRVPAPLPEAFRGRVQALEGRTFPLPA
ncbi:MAG: acyl-CoA thioesterase [Alphaproteobacteria bacterium]|nr:acyl-CoA thioesterase [Alphaproteobacteria bacterium]